MPADASCFRKTKEVFSSSPVVNLCLFTVILYSLSVLLFVIDIFTSTRRGLGKHDGSILWRLPLRQPDRFGRLTGPTGPD